MRYLTDWMVSENALCRVQKPLGRISAQQLEKRTDLTYQRSRRTLWEQSEAAPPLTLRLERCVLNRGQIKRKH
jgi:hypothetical protein